ncbi:MAG: hypothetical protein ACJ77K_05200 [Bacteroidia bacterium]
MKQLYLAFVLITLASCGITRKPYGNAGKCELHGTYLHASIVRIRYGYACPFRTRLGNGSEAFPNARHPVCGGCVVGKPFRLEYNCSKCNRARVFYIVSHKSNPEQNIKSKF